MYVVYCRWYIFIGFVMLIINSQLLFTTSPYQVCYRDIISSIRATLLIATQYAKAYGNWVTILQSSIFHHPGTYFMLQEVLLRHQNGARVGWLREMAIRREIYNFYQFTLLCASLAVSSMTEMWLCT